MAPTGTAIVVGDSQFGPVLFDAAGQAIYLFEPEGSGVPQCYNECAAAWPPVLTTSAPRGGNGIAAELLGEVPRSDGTRQVSYGGRPLYYYAHEGRHVVECHNILSFGGLWFAITAAGEAAPV